MFQYISGVVRMLSPVICFLFLFTSLNLSSMASQLHRLDQENSRSKGSSGGGASSSKTEHMVSSSSKPDDRGGDTTKSQIDSNLVVPENSKSIPGWSSGGGSSAKHLHRIADASINLHLGPQNLAPNECQNGKRSHSPVLSKSGNLSEEPTTQRDPGILRKTGFLNRIKTAAPEETVKFDAGRQYGILVLTLDISSKLRTPLSKARIELVSDNRNVLFELRAGEFTGTNLISITARELDSLARIDYKKTADSLVQYDRLLVINEESQKVLLLDFTAPSGALTLHSQNLGSEEIGYSFSMIPVGSLSSQDLPCDICLTALGVASWLVVEIACVWPEGTSYGIAVIICIVSAKLSILAPPLATVLVPLCIYSVPFVIQWGPYIVQTLCYLEEQHDAADAMTSWFCTNSGACSDVYPPLVYINSPDTGDGYTGIFSINVTLAGEASTIDWVEFDYSTNGGSTWFDVVGPGHSNGITVFEGEGSILFDTEEAGIVYSNSMKVRVRAADTEGNTSGWVESEGLFVVDNRGPDITSIAVSLNLNPNPASPYSAVDAYGTAQYNTGAPVTNGTVTISHSADTLTAWLDENGNYSRTISAPSSSRWVTASATDGNLTGTDQEYLTVTSDGSGDGFTFYRSTMCRDADDTSPYDPIGETHWFRTNDADVYCWVHLTDLYVSAQVRWYWYLPDGSQFLNPLTSDCTDDPQGGVYDWWKLYYGWSIAGYSLADYEGRHSVKIYAKECGQAYEYMESQYWILAYDLSHHLMCKDVGPYPNDPIDSTNTFLTTDVKAMTWAKFTDVSESIEVKWEYYEPSGALYDSFEHTTDDPGPGSYYGWTKAWGWIWIDGHAAASKCGRWTVKVYEKDVWGNWDELYTDHFVIKEAVNQNPSVNVTLNTDPPMEGQNLSVTVSGSDNCSIESATLYWDTGTLDSSKWQAIYQPTFSQQADLGSFSANQSIEIYARMTDASGNLGESEHLFITVADLDTEGPEVASVLVAENSGNNNGRLEDCEQVHISFSVTDPSGVDSVALIVDSTEVVLQGTYYSVVGPLQSGQHTVTILAIDADEPPAANIWVDTFFVDSVPDAPQDIITPEDGDTIYAAPVVFTWRSVATADSGYEIQIDTTQAFNSPILFVDTLRSRTDTTLQVEPTPNHRYYWRLASRSYCGQSGYSEHWDFFTSWTGVAEESDELTTPQKFALFQNHPNPFNPETQINYYLPRSCQVALIIYNVKGQKVRILVNEYQGTGSKLVKWDGMDDQGQEVASGVYFYRIITGKFSETKKMLLLR